jgi:hypothetical protein
VNPGGPFISIFGDVLPFTLSLLAIWCAVPCVAYPARKIKASAIAHIILAAGIIGVKFCAASIRPWGYVRLVNAKAL